MKKSVLVVITFVSMQVWLFAEKEEKYMRGFSVPRGFEAALRSKYFGDNLKELLSNAGANLEKDDTVIPPSGAGLIVNSTPENLDVIAEIVSSCSPIALATTAEPKQVKEVLLKTTWDFGGIQIQDSPIGHLKFEKKGLAKNVAYLDGSGSSYRWALTKQNVIELRQQTGGLIFTAVVDVSAKKIHILSIGSIGQTSIVIGELGKEVYQPIQVEDPFEGDAEIDPFAAEK